MVESRVTWVALFTLLLTACASGRPRSTTWEDDAREGLGARTSAPRRSAPRAVPIEPTTIRSDAEPPAEDYGALAHDLELALLRFTSRRRGLMALAPRGDGWPVPVHRAWRGILTRLRDGLGRPLGVFPRRLLIQTRVTLEAELELTERRFGHIPDSIRDQTNRLFARVAMHMRATPSEDRIAKRPSAYDVALAYPLSPLIVTSPFGYRRDPILGEDHIRFHAGVDLGGSRGDVVTAAGPGRVVGASWVGGHGRTVTVQHPGGYTTRYAHLARILVRAGDEVEAGSPLGLVGSTGRSTGPHLHFEVRQGSVPVDPLDVLTSGDSRFASR